MKKEQFYDELTERLTSLGVEQTYIMRHIKQFDGYFAGKDESQISDEIAKMGDMDRLAVRIKRMTDSIIVDEQSGNQSNEPASDQSSTIGKLFSSTEQDDNHHSPFPEGNAGCAGTSQKPKDNTSVDDEDVDISFDEEIRKWSDACNDGSADHGKKPSGSSFVKAPSTAELSERKKKFYLQVALTSPLWIIGILLIAAAFATIYFIVGMIIVLAIAVLIADTAAGSVISILGLSFAVARMVSSLPIGLYEFGISVMIGAVALLFGVLIYNFIVRLMPYVILKLIDLTKFVINRLKKLYYDYKKERIGG